MTQSKRFIKRSLAFVNIRLHGAGYAASISSNLSIELASGSCCDDLFAWFCKLMKSQSQAEPDDCKLPCCRLNTASRADAAATLLKLDCAFVLATAAPLSRVINC